MTTTSSSQSIVATCVQPVGDAPSPPPLVSYAGDAVTVDAVDTREMTALQMLSWCGTDARRWAHAFTQYWPDRSPDEGTMIGWFANAMETAVIAAKIAATKPRWECFHCGEEFASRGGAQEHFGRFPEGHASCEVEDEDVRTELERLRRIEMLWLRRCDEEADEDYE